MFERNVKHVAMQPLDWHAEVARSSPVENFRVKIETDDVAHASLSQLGRQDAITTPHVQDASCSMWDRLQEQRMILDVGIPEPIECHAKG